MTEETIDVQQITGTARPVKALLSDRYGLDFYQREYSWEDIQVSELVEDLAGRFLDEFDSTHERDRVAFYRPYFLGPIMTTQRGGIRYLVDGQQRITTLSLLLIYLHRSLTENFPEDASSLNALIFSSDYGRRTFNLDVDERKQCLDAILNGNDFSTDGEPESVRNLWRQYITIAECFPSDLQGEVLPYFADWLLHRVILVDIIAPDQDMALEIFETMNDRGLRLNNIDMLKSYLLARVGEENMIQTLNDRWRRRVTELADIEKNADAEFVKAWLRGHWAQTQRQRKANSSPGDFDIIGTAFHKWVRDNFKTIGLETEGNYRTFVERDFFGLSGRYLELLRASHEFTSGLESVYYNSKTGFTLQLLAILAALTPDDDDETFVKKAALVSGTLDIFVVRRMVNYRNFGYSTVVYNIFNLVKSVRNKQPEELRSILANWLSNEDEQLDGISSLGLNQRNRSHIRYILARITAWLDSELGEQGTFVKYLDKSLKYPFEVEHIIADHFDRYTMDFESEDEFQECRNRIGGLLLLPKDFNASYGDMPYNEKVKHYYAQNSLARSLNASAYNNNPTFIRFLKKYELAFNPHPSIFAKKEVSERQTLYQALAKALWDPKRLGIEF